MKYKVHIIYYEVHLTYVENSGVNEYDKILSNDKVYHTEKV